MADEQDKWLDRVAAERLLRGERLDGIGDHDRERAERLAQALAALSAGKPAKTGEDGELPGECGALAAFRAARSGQTFASGAAGAAGATGAAGAVGTGAGAASGGVPGGAPDPVDAPVRIGGSAAVPRPVRWGRPLRLGVAAALAACMAGGVAVAAGTGVIPSPFHRADRAPATSASPVQTPDRPLRSPSTDAAAPPDELPDEEDSPLGDDTSAEPDPSATSAGPERSAAPDDGRDRGATGSPGTDAVDPGEDGKRNDRKWYKHVVSACRDYRSGGLATDKRRRLEEAARGAERVRAFCERVLDGKGKGKDKDRDQDDDKPGRGNGGGNGHGNDGDDEDDDHGGGHLPGGGHHGGRPGGGSQVPPVTLPHRPRPVPSYTAAPVF
ncbi:extensin [Streptomyces sp. NPDC053474]|uniref:extensin n=1 Tax=Streptomyces sp. NPDC053474 TaxID=3365704 RepID=UPI0037D00AA9